jgi:hypothetical protein
MNKQKPTYLNSIRTALLLSLWLGLMAAAYQAQAFYASEFGRWINRDPLEEAGGYNLYGFLRGDPVTLVDAFGQQGRSSQSLQLSGVPVIPMPPGGGAGGNGSILGPPGHTGAGNNTTTGPGIGCAPLGKVEIFGSVPFTCPCTMVDVKCEVGRVCSDSGFSVPSFAARGAPIPLWVWKPYRKCEPCPEGQY